MNKEAKKALLTDRRKKLAQNGKDNMGVLRKIDRQLRNMSK